MNSYLTSLFDQYFNLGQMTFLQSCSFDGIATLLAKKIYLSLFFSLLFLTNLFAQPVVDVCLTPTTEGPYVAGQMVIFETIVTGFENVNGFQFGIVYDPIQMNYQSSSDESIPFTFVNAPNPGDIRVSWSTISGGPVALPDGSNLLSFTFEITDDSEDLSIELTNSPFSVEFLDSNNSLFSVTQCGFYIAGPPIIIETIDFCLKTELGIYSQGETVWTDIRVENFINIEAVTFSVTYDPEKLEFIEATGNQTLIDMVDVIGSDGFLVITYGGIIGDDPMTLPDMSEMVSLTFEVLESIVELPIELLESPDGIEAFTAPYNGIPVPYTICGELPVPNPPIDVCFLITNMEVLNGEEHGPALEASDFTNVTDFNFRFSYNAEENDFIEINPHSMLAGATATEITPGLVEVTWSGPSTTLDDSEAFMDVVFEATVNFADRNFELITTDGFSSITHANEEDGLFIFCGTEANQIPVDFCLDFEPGVYAPGQETTIAFDVANFTSITSISAEVVYDAFQLDFIEGVDNGLLGDSLVIAEEEPGRISIRYNGTDEVPVSVISGTALLGLTFEVQEPTTFLNIDFSDNTTAFWALSNMGPLPVNNCGVPLVNSAASNVTCSLRLGNSGVCGEVSDSTGLAGWLVTFTDVYSSSVYSGITGDDGQAFMNVPIGDYIQHWTPPGNPLNWNYCNDLQVTIAQENEFVNFDHTATVVFECPYLQVAISSGNLRPCFENNLIRVHYGNYGTVAAENAYVDVAIDSDFTILSSSIAHTDLGNGLYRFDLGTVNISVDGNITITGHIDCDFPVGAAICASATIYPRPLDCTPPDPSFQGANLQVTPSCDNDSIRFQIKNIGDGPSGEIEFHVIEDVIIYNNGTIDIDAGELMEMAFAAEGTTFRLELDRPEAAPYLSHPLGIEEGCGMLTGGGISVGFVNDFSLLDDDPWFDRYCQETSAAYDPNDKQAIPAGVGEDNDIFPNQTMDYKIRFQNTGTDTAFNVTLRDQIDTSVLNLSTFTAGASSHPYRVMILNNELVFTFENILLPDSTTNPIASNGYVHFQIAQQPDLPDGTVIENDAAIYFDFNEPIITNISRQTIDRNLLISSTRNFTVGEVDIPVYPSPVINELYFDLVSQRTVTELVITDLFGRVVLRQRLLGGRVSSIDLSRLIAGQYAYQLIQSGRLLQSGTVVKH
ncbi:hypothetical protein CEQ90_10245 [Lewinellaceae bacterium SD302]|nr:hypothetical protein CEQ90_10245 [Lewinellaceae bacterium SD302]